ncbi:MAG: MgtC/SapB family protein [Acidimicrobiia bacterium]
MNGFELATRLGLAALCGLAIGLERQLNQHEAGMRTHILVALGAALFTVAGAYGFEDLDRAAIDPARVAAQVATGVGFIGAGLIIREGPSIRGLTSAATLWLTGALGVAAGAGASNATLIATAIVLLTLAGLRVAKPSIASWSSQAVTLEIEYGQGKGTLGPILEAFEQRHLRLEHLKIRDDAEASVRRVFVTVSGRKLSGLEDLTKQIRGLNEVRQVELRRQFDGLD